ncbi:MAG: hypothetical protein JWQ14_507 [Adhaeribacter sp.]|nr:hypothetical protein [Adhaeribacter sp.]
MKAMEKFIHLSLVVALLLGSMGFSVREPHCEEERSQAINLFAAPGCCCDTPAAEASKPCPDLTCVMQRGLASQTTFTAATNPTAKFLKAPLTYPSFTESIRPAILETIPHFTLPPPASGRFIGILHQSFII